MTVPTPPAAPADPAAPPVVEAPPAQAKPETDWKAEARKHEARAKENAAAAAELAALKESQKTEAQKLADKVVETERKVTATEDVLNRYKVALKHGLAESDIEDLNWSGTDEEIEARVKRFVERKAADPRPKGDPDQGPRGTAPTAGPAEEFASFLQAQLRQ